MIKKAIKYFELLVSSPSVGMSLFLAFEAWCVSYYLVGRWSEYLPPVIPIWNSSLVLSARLGPTSMIWLLPMIGLFILIINAIICILFLKLKQQILALTFALYTLALEVSVSATIVYICLKTAPTLATLPSYLMPMFGGLVLAFVIAYLITPFTIKLSTKLQLVDDPATRVSKHPAILHKKPIPRGGALPLYIAVVVVSLILLPHEPRYLMILFACGIAVATGLLDDKYDVNPYIRLAPQLLITLMIIVVGIQFRYITNPFGGVIHLDLLPLSLGLPTAISIVASVITAFWLLWVMNMINWSNGVDGQFGVVTIFACLVLGALALRFADVDKTQIPIALLLFITAGAILGTLPYNWHPAKMFYGFGVTFVGLLLAVAAIVSGMKVATALLVMIVPTLDAAYAILRRLRSKKSPVWGDRQHLHHKLLDYGFSHQQIAIIYGITAMVFGLLALFTSGRAKLLTLTAAGGLFIFILSFLDHKLNSTQASEAK